MEENQNVYGVWVPTYQCPRRCPWCLTRPRNRRSPFTGADVFLRAAEPFGQVTVNISGGEPLTSVAYALAAAKVSHYYPTMLLTSLSLPITEETFRSFMLNAKPENVRIYASLHTMSSSKYTLTFQDIEREKYFIRVQELVNRGFAIGVNILYTNKNKNSVVLKAAERLAQIGVAIDFIPYKKFDQGMSLAKEVEAVDGDKVLINRVNQILHHGRYKEVMKPRMKKAFMIERINIEVSDEVSKAYTAMVPTRGLLCSAGVKMFYLDDFGHLRRCLNENNPIIDGPLKGPQPCEVDNCVCVDQCRFIIDKYPPQTWNPIDSSRFSTSSDSTVDAISCMDQRDIRIANLEAELNRIYNSHAWKALLFYYKVRNKIFPINSKRRKVARFVWKLLCKFL